MASPNLKRHLYSRPRQRGHPKSSKTRELDRAQIVFVFNVEEIVTLELPLLSHTRRCSKTSIQSPLP